VEARFPLTLRAARANSNKLELALLNLAVNARDAMPNGGPLVIAAREEALPPPGIGLKAGNYICLSVTDHGMGMDEATLAKATEPFFTTKGVGKGTGLGLSMVHGMGEQSGGRLVLKSREGEGTTAELWLPVAEVQAAVGLERRDLRQDHKSAILALPVLAVDDDALVLMNTSAMLEDIGHTVFGAKSGKEALNILRRERDIDLVITDQAMPQMTGTELAKAIRAEWPRLPIIMATGYSELPPGAAADLPRLAKPFSQEEIARAVEAATRSRLAAP